MKQSNTEETVGHPLQTKEWGKFREKTGNIIVREENLLLTLHPIPFFKNFKVGALIKGPKPTKPQITKLKEIAKRENLLFIKMEPNALKNDASIKLLQENGAVRGKTLFTPTTFWIDLTKSEEELLKGFSSKTRYNIKVAQKHGVEIFEDNSDKAFEKYIELTRETVQRQRFYAHSEKYHRLMWQTLHTEMVENNKSPIAHLLVAKYQGEIITTWVLFTLNDFLYYPYGASTNKFKNVMANNLMMWEAIKFGKRMNLKIFDLWGREPGKGFTPFKEGYSPKVVEFLGSWDLVTSPLYSIYLLLDKLRWIFLRFKSKFVSPTF